MEYYRNQPIRQAFSGTTLTSTFAGNQHVFESAGFVKLTVYMGYTPGEGESSTTLDMKLEASPDNGTTWTSLVIDETSTTSEITERVWNMGGTTPLNVIVDIAYNLMRVSVKETGAQSNAGTANVYYQLSGL